MKILMAFLVLNLVVESSQQSLRNHLIHKRSLWNFGKIIQCAQGMNSWFPFWALGKYSDYGCHCGIAGSGRIVDETDKCCYEHDRCYGKVTRKYGSGLVSIFMDTLSYDCKDQKIDCKDDNLAKKAICQCDKECAECMAKYKDTYKDSNKRLEPKYHCH